MNIENTWFSPTPHTAEPLLSDGNIVVCKYSMYVGRQTVSSLCLVFFASEETRSVDDCLENKVCRHLSLVVYLQRPPEERQHERRNGGHIPDVDLGVKNIRQQK